MNNRPVVVNHTPPAQGAALTVGGAAHVTGELSVNDTLRIGQWEIRDEYDRNGGQRVLRVYFDGQRTDTISAG